MVWRSPSQISHTSQFGDFLRHFCLRSFGIRFLYGIGCDDSFVQAFPLYHELCGHTKAPPAVSRRREIYFERRLCDPDFGNFSLPLVDDAGESAIGLDDGSFYRNRRWTLLAGEKTTKNLISDASTYFGKLRTSALHKFRIWGCGFKIHNTKFFLFQ